MEKGESKKWECHDWATQEKPPRAGNDTTTMGEMAEFRALLVCTEGSRCPPFSTPALQGSFYWSQFMDGTTKSEQLGIMVMFSYVPIFQKHIQKDLELIEFLGCALK